MIALARYTLLFWRTSLWRTLLQKRTALIVLGAAVPPGIVGLTAYVPHPPWPIQAFLFASFWLVLQLFVPLAAVITGSGLLASELEDCTITYLMTRPAPRASILLGRWLATLTLLFACTAASVGAVGLITEYRARNFEPPAPRVIEIPARGDRPARTRTIDEPPPDAILSAMSTGKLPSGLLASVLATALVGVTVYSALFAALGARLKHPLIVGLAYIGAIEGALATLPGKSQSLTVQFYLRSYLSAEHLELWRTVEDVVWLGLDSGPRALVTLAIVLVLALAAGCWAISRREYVVTS